MLYNCGKRNQIIQIKTFTNHLFFTHSAMLSIPSIILFAVIGLTASFPLDEDMQNMLFDLGYIDLSQYGRSIFGDPDNSTGERIANYDPMTNDQNPEELGSYLEGDILMPLGQARNGLTASGARWPNAIIPYEIRGDFGKLKSNI